LGAFSAIVRTRSSSSAAPSEYPYEVVILKHDEPVMLCRHRLELRDDWQMRERDFNVWKTVDPPALWVEKCKTLGAANHLASQRTETLNRLADLFDAETAVSLYRRWEIAVS
jgi:hypothetical protein